MCIQNPPKRVKCIYILEFVVSLTTIIHVTVWPTEMTEILPYDVGCDSGRSGLREDQTSLLAQLSLSCLFAWH